MAQGPLQLWGSRALRRMGLARRRHVERLEAELEDMHAEATRLRYALAEAQNGNGTPEPADVELPSAPDLPDQAALRAELEFKTRQIIVARRELLFRTRKWRDLASGTDQDRQKHCFGFEPLALRTATVAPDRRLYVKTMLDRPLLTGLSAVQAFHLEALCLTRLHETAAPGAPRFPVPVQLDLRHRRIVATDQGRSLDMVPEAEKPALIRQIAPSLGEQVGALTEALRRARVVHLDMHSSGRNITVDDTGHLSLIDFDIAVIDEEPFSGEIARRYVEWQRGGAYERTRQNLMAIVGAFIRR